MIRPPGVILAGGLASRMGGGDKALLPLGGETILGHIRARIAPQVGALALNANGDAARFGPYGLPVLADPVAGHPGPLAGVLAAMLWAEGQGAEAVVTVAGDTPFFPRDLVAQLMAAAAGMEPPLVLAASGGRRHPVFGLWPVGLRDALRADLEKGMRRVGQWAEGRGARAVGFDTGRFDPFFNINTPQDLDVAREMLAGGA